MQSPDPPIGAALSPEGDSERFCQLLARMAALDPVPAVTAAAEAFIDLLGEQGGCIVVEPHPHVLAARHEGVSAGTPIDLACYPELLATAAGDLFLDALDSGGSDRVSGRDLMPVGFRSLAVLPLAAGGRHLGWLWACSPRTPKEFTERDRATARFIGKSVEMVLVRLAPTRHGMRSPGKSDSSAAVPVGRTATPIWGVDVGDAQARPRLMVVEDDEDFAREICEALVAQGYDVVTFGSAETAIEAARKNPPALLLLDVHLPDSDGFVLAMELADDRRTAAVPVLFVSADEALAVRVRGFRDGEADFLRKPFELDDLLTRVDACVVRAERRNRLRRTARIDELTGLGNVRFLEERLIVESSRQARYRTPLSVVVGDVDGLKTINDTQGHAAGSAVLRAVGEALSLEIRDTDLAVRYGGDEFVVLLPHTALPDATRFAERLLARIRRLRPCGLGVSISFGVAAFDKERDASVRDLLERADQAAYRAKRAGGDRIHSDASPAGESAA